MNLNCYIYTIINNNLKQIYMKVSTKIGEEFIDIDRIVIRINDVDFRVSANKFGDLIINKFQTGDGETAIVILPNISNEIRIR